MLQKIILVFCLLLACGEPSRRTQTLEIFAASSLREGFERVEKSFEKRNPNVDVHVNFAGSQVLRLQLEQGANADVFASANAEHMLVLQQAGKVGHSRMFALNELVLAVPTKGELTLRSLNDLQQAKRIVVANPSVPAGTYTREFLSRAKDHHRDELVQHIQKNIVSEENNVRLVRAKVEMGEADAAFLYRSDTTHSANLRAIALPAELGVQAQYFVGEVKDSRQKRLASRFVDFLVSEEGQKELELEGFIRGASEY